MKGEACMQEECLSTVVPVYNEEQTRHHRWQIACAATFTWDRDRDDCSTDRTPEILEELSTRHGNIHAVHHGRNRGKTEALKTSFRLTRGHIVIIQDADLEYDPQEIPDVVAPILTGQADVVLGSRFLVRKTTRALYFSHYLGNKLLTFCSNLATNVNLTDVALQSYITSFATI